MSFGEEETEFNYSDYTGDNRTDRGASESAAQWKQMLENYQAGNLDLGGWEEFKTFQEGGLFPQDVALGMGVHQLNPQTTSPDDGEADPSAMGGAPNVAPLTADVDRGENPQVSFERISGIGAGGEDVNDGGYGGDTGNTEGSIEGAGQSAFGLGGGAGDVSGVEGVLTKEQQRQMMAAVQGKGGAALGLGTLGGISAGVGGLSALLSSFPAAMQGTVLAMILNASKQGLQEHAGNVRGAQYTAAQGGMSQGDVMSARAQGYNPYGEDANVDAYMDSDDSMSSQLFGSEQLMDSDQNYSSQELGHMSANRTGTLSHLGDYAGSIAQGARDLGTHLSNLQWSDNIAGADAPFGGHNVGPGGTDTGPDSGRGGGGGK